MHDPHDDVSPNERPGHATADAVADEAVVGILEAYQADLEAGGSADPATILAAHPDKAAALRPCLEMLRELHQAAGAVSDAGPARHAATRTAAVSDTEPIGSGADSGARRVIGEYRVIREIGRGGMGVVYEAEQMSLRRTVALKVLPFAGMLDRRHVARFRNEAQAAAQLHHPHVVPVFAVGEDRGVHFYSMQFIDGRSLDDPRDVLEGWADRGASFFRVVARIGREAADALQHAHENGIIHRDIKPSNLMLDAKGKLWVTDFGLARIQVDGGLTLTGDIIGTLRYMSPEQAGGRPELVDARSDVYALGVTLYELLTGRRAFDGEDRQGLLRAIVEDEPVPPRRCAPSIPHDLETIVLAAMAKSRDDRYASARDLAADLDRYLDGKPPLARRPTSLDRAARWAWRHRSLVAVAAAALVLLSIVSASGVVLLAREQRRAAAALRQAQENLADKERYFRRAFNAVDTFGMGQADRLQDITGAESLRRDLLLETLRFYKQFAAEAKHDPRVQEELAAAHMKAAVIAARLGLRDDALGEYAEARGILGPLAAAHPENGELAAQFAVAGNNSALLLASAGDVARARREYDDAIALQRRLVATHPHEPSHARQLAESLSNLGMLRAQEGDSEAAESLLQEAVGLLRGTTERLQAHGQEDGSPTLRGSRHDLAIALHNLSSLLAARDLPAAQEAAVEAVRILEQLAAAGGFPAPDDDLALYLGSAAVLESRAGRDDAAIEQHQRAIVLQEKMVRSAPAVVRHHGDLANSLTNLGIACCRAGRGVEADEAFARSLAVMQVLVADHPENVAFRGAHAALLNNQALALAAAGRHDEAIQRYAKAIAEQRECVERLPDAAQVRDALSRMLYNRAELLERTGRFSEALADAVARRGVWAGHPERLVAVAAEIARIDNACRSATQPASTPGSSVDDVEPGADMQTDIQREALTTLREALRSGWTPAVDLAVDERFLGLHGSEGFATLLASLEQTGGRREGEADTGTGGGP